MKITRRLAWWHLTQELEDALWLSHWNEEAAWQDLMKIAYRAAKETSNGEEA